MPIFAGIIAGERKIWRCVNSHEVFATNGVILFIDQNDLAE